MLSSSAMQTTKTFPLDLSRTSYSYIERPNPAIQSLLARHVLPVRSDARILDVGCGCGANARAIRERSPAARVVGIEPNPRAAELARPACSDVFCGTVEQWQREAGETADTFDGVVLSDVLEHIADPVAFLGSLTCMRTLRSAVWIISVPNYAVWYNRLATLLGRQRYAWSGLWDRTHLRVFTRESVGELLEYCGMSVIDSACTPSLVQSTAPLLRKMFERDVERGDHLALSESGAYKVYRDVIEPIETRVCALLPELLGFQVVLTARVGPDRSPGSP
jgi:2-polyprenyl-3-methyl-5-hydroxy-6-metoxy-1,4-benzoquinol methylase